MNTFHSRLATSALSQLLCILGITIIIVFFTSTIRDINSSSIEYQIGFDTQIWEENKQEKGKGFGMGTNNTIGVTRMEDGDVAMLKVPALSPPRFTKEEKPRVTVAPRTVRIFWQDDDATDSSSDEEYGQLDDGKANSGRQRIKRYGCVIKLKQEQVPVPGKANSGEAVIAEITRLNS